MTNDLISVIIPVYKVEKYLGECVRNVLAQTYKNIEVILVDDGSPDNCPAICDELSQVDNRVRTIHKENGGVSSARNKGIDCSNGKYITFVDSDDTLTPDAIEILYHRINETATDFSAGSINWCTKSGVHENKVGNVIQYGNDIALNTIKNIKTLDGSVWGKLYKKSIIDDNDLKFNCTIPMAEDTVFLIQYLGCCKKIAFVDRVVYNYNLTVDGSAIKKYYPNYDVYLYELHKVCKESINKSSISDADKKTMISAVANKMCCNTVYYYITALLPGNELLTKINSVRERYIQEVKIESFEKSEVRVVTCEQFKYLIDGDIKGFIKKWRKDLRSKDFISYCKFNVKFILKKIKLMTHKVSKTASESE